MRFFEVVMMVVVKKVEVDVEEDVEVVVTIFRLALLYFCLSW